MNTPYSSSSQHPVAGTYGVDPHQEIESILTAYPSSVVKVSEPVVLESVVPQEVSAVPAKISVVQDVKTHTVTSKALSPISNYLSLTSIPPPLST